MGPLGPTSVRWIGGAHRVLPNLANFRQLDGGQIGGPLGPTGVRWFSGGGLLVPCCVVRLVSVDVGASWSSQCQAAKSA